MGGLGGKDYSGNKSRTNVVRPCSMVYAGLFFLLKKGKTDAQYVGIMYAISRHFINVYFLSGSLTSSHIITSVPTMWLPPG